MRWPVFVRRQLAVAVLVQLLQRRRRVGYFIGVDHSVAICVERCFDRRLWVFVAANGTALRAGFIWRGTIRRRRRGSASILGFRIER